MDANNSIYLRPALGFTPKENRNNLVAFSPDILPLHKTKIADADQLTSTYDSFVAQTVVPEESNLVYVRGAAVNPYLAAYANVNLFTVTNELVLWPQVLKEAAAIGNISLDYNPLPEPVMFEQGRTASIKSIGLTPPGQGGRHDAIISAIGYTAFDGIADAKNIKDLLAIVDSNPALAFYNAVVADPVFDVYSFTTRLRFFDDSPNFTHVELDVESIGMPSGYDVVIFSTDPGINMARTAIVAGHRVGTTISVKNGFDALISVQVYKGKGSLPPPNYASISLVASTVQTSNRIETLQVIGAEHVLFDSSTRPLRGIVKAQQLGEPTAGLYFRDNIGDTNVVPRTGVASHSAGNQPLGTGSDSTIAPTRSWSTNITIPDVYPSNTPWTLVLVCHEMPLNGAIELSATGSINFNTGMTTVVNPDMGLGVNFTGFAAPFSSTVTYSWWQESGPPMPADATLTLQLLIHGCGAGVLAEVTPLAKKLGLETENWPLVVGPDYPHLLDSVPKDLDSKKVKGKYLLGKAHPIQPVPHAGIYKESNIMAWPQVGVVVSVKS